MTREEAKREILFAKREVIANSWIDKAYDMAIEALAQPDIVRCEDCEYYHHCRCDAWSSFVLDDGYCYKAIRERR